MDPLSIAFGLCGLPFVKEGLEKCLREQVFIHLRSYHKRIQKLEKSVKKLESDKSDVQQIVEEEEDRYGRGILGEVANWIKNADEIICEYGRFIGDERQRLVSKGDYLPNLRARYSLVRKAYDLKRRIDEIFEKKNDSVISYWLGPPSIAPFLANIGYESFSSRDETIKKLNAALENPSVKIIGVYGWSGVGKTTLVKEVAKEALQVKDTEARMFDMVIMASMGNNPAIVKIQGQIADMIGITLVGESEIARAAQIQNKLKNLKRRILIILDDLHEKVDFNMLGIQFENDDIVEETTLEPNVLETQPNDTMKNQNPRGKSKGEVLEEPPNSNNPSSNMVNSKKLFNSSNVTKTKETPRFKVLVISASKQVLSSQMELKEDHIFFVDVLEKKEAEKLFKKIVGADYLKSGFENLASQIASKCGGLPMSIVTTARALKSHQSYSVWETVLSDLQQGKLKRELEFSTKLSYDLLENEELKHTFLLCPFIGHDALVMDLMKYCIGLGILQGKNTIKEARVAVFAMIEKLKQSGLLSESFSIDHFSIQNVARQAAISISSQENVVYSITKIKLDEWPEKLKTCVAIFLHHCDIIEVFSCKITFSWLKIFRLDNNDPCPKIPKNFFKTMKKLKVLILSGIYLSPLPSSIRSLTKLRMFSLENCMLQGKELSIIGELRRLRILSFSGSDIEKLPVELKQLTNLQIFDMSNCYKLREIPTGVISCLTSLEELYMRNSLILSKEEKQAEESLCTVLSELKYLDQLRTLDIQISDIVHLPDNLFLDKLHNYKIVLGDLNVNLETDFKMPEKHETTRFLAINLKDNFDIHSQMGIKMLFDRVENLLLKELKGVEDVFNGLNLKGFPCLKNLMISGNDSIQSLFDPRDTSQAFLKLESLYLNDLKNMSKVCGCVLSKDSFGKLKVIKINQCSQLEVVFSISLVEHLTSLEIIEVSECNSLKKIVYVENESNSNEIKFHELRSLTLESLSDLIGFSSEAEEPTQAITLFGGKVSVSKLERMKLSSLNIQKIWSAESKFEKLTLLEVNDCWKLKYLIPFSMVSSLVNLQSLFISKCDNMESIFKDDKTKVTKDRNIFRKLKNIKLSNMNNLTEIWNSALPETSFGHLETLIIEQCHKIPNVFSHTDYMKGIFRSLCSLTVADCRLMGEIFDLNKYNEKEVELNLQDIHVETLPKLEQIWKWNGEQEKSLKLNKLEKLWVHGCDRLVNVFPFSAARCLDKKLECLVVCDCTRLQEIFAKEIVPKGEADNPTVEFSSLNTIKFSKLPKVERFYPGNFELRALNDLSIQSCNQLELFSSIQTKPLVQAINKVKSLEIEPSNSTGEWNWSHRKDKLKELCISGLTTTQILYSFFYSSPHLESLSLNGCFFEDIEPFESLEKENSLGIVPKLKSLKLANMPYLENLGIEPSLILARVEFMILENCRWLVTMVPSSVSLTHLTNLEVTNCGGLKTLMSPSTAKSLCQLNTMKVSECESLEEIVGNAEKFGEKVDIVFKQLKNLELVSLENLNCFSCSKGCVFKFPSLEKLVVRACCKMKSFAEMEGKQMLRRIDIYADIDVKIMSCRWKDDLNAAIKKMFQEKRYYDGMQNMILTDDLAELRPAWRGEVALQTHWFSTLKILRLDGCDYLKPYAIPSNVLPYLKTLKELDVSDCDKVKGIFGMNDRETMGTTTFQLQKLELYNLVGLTSVWEKDDLSFQNLEAVYVSDCGRLASVFPLKVAKNLKKLQKIQIESCDRLRQIVGMEGVAEANRTEEFVFPRLTLMDLFELPKLSRLGDFTLECPSLNQLSVLGCPMFESAQLQGSGVMKAISNVEELSLEGNLISVVDQPDTEFRYLHKIGMRFDKSDNPTQPIQILKKAANLQEMRIHDCSNRHIFEFGGVGVQHLEELTLEEKFQKGMDDETFSKYHLQQLWVGNDSEQSNWFEGLKIMKLVNCKVKGYAIPSNILSCLKSLQELEMRGCNQVTFIFGMKGTESVKIASPLRKLWLVRLSVLTHVWEDNCQAISTTFQNLEQVYVENCKSLQSVFPAAIGKNLKKLKKLEIKYCDELKEIVGTVQHQIAEETAQVFEIPALTSLYLRELPKLTCFYPEAFTLLCLRLNTLFVLQCPKLEILSIAQPGSDGSSTSINRQSLFSDLELPSLKRVEIEECPKMDNFCPYLEEQPFQAAPNLSTYDSDGELVLHNDLNISLRRAFFQQKFENGMDNETFSKHHLQQVWVDKVSEQSYLFEGLKIMKLVNCEVQGYAIPSNILSCLKSLQELEMRGCNQVTFIFGMKGTESVKIASPLRKLWLVGLSVLTHVWEDNCQAITTTFQNLERVHVENCKSLQGVFPAAIGKNLKKLKKLEIKYCDELKEIVGTVQHQIAEETAQVFEIPALTSLYLRELPKLTCFYPEAFTLMCLRLNTLFVLQCPKLEILSIAQPGSDGSSTSINRQSLFSDLELPSLEGVETEECPKMDNFCPQLETRHVDFNMSVLVQDFEKGMDIETFSKHHLQQLWVHKVSKQSNFFEALKSMKLVNCEFEGYAIPSNILPCLKSLQELKIEDCNQVNFIFDMKTESVKIAFLLRKLWLKRLPVLTHVWEDNCQAITTTFQNLEQVHVEKCKSLQMVFPAAMAKNLKKLEKLEIKYCDELKEIVGKVQHQIAEETAQVFEIPALTTLYLQELPKLTCFYPEAFTLICLRLNTLFVLECPKLEILSIAQPGSDGSSTSINRQSLVSDLELPSLKGVEIEECPKMDNFCPHLEAQFSRYNGELVLHNDLNISVRRAFFRQLWNLPTLKEIYSGTHTLEWPSLRELDVYHCQMLKCFATEYQNSTKDQDMQLIVSLKKKIEKVSSEMLSLKSMLADDSSSEENKIQAKRNSSPLLAPSSGY
ncbi:hypothetical protein RJT34_15439 [Clitoria ternatea]|uniref:AAA+ ATPase domain-containing protein n=1 Tax=Clitoria ternatea TaxID=43366 RepID=A0AAN9J785_CLITE